MVAPLGSTGMAGTCCEYFLFVPFVSGNLQPFQRAKVNLVAPELQYIQWYSPWELGKSREASRKSIIMLLRRRFYFVNFWSDGSVLDPSVHFGPSNVPIQYFLISFIVSYSLPGKKNCKTHQNISNPQL